MNRTLFSPLQQLQAQSKLLMCPPTYYKLLDPDPVHGHPNDMNARYYDNYQRDPSTFTTTAYVQWKKLYSLITKLGIHIELLEPDAACADQVFTADASLSLVSKTNAISIISQFSHWGRHTEPLLHKEKIEKLFPSRTIIYSNYPLEGSGDNIYDAFRNIFWCGHTYTTSNIASGRSSKQAHYDISNITDITTISIQVQRPFFHLDTAFAPLSRGHIVYYPEGLEIDATHKIITRGLQPYGLNPFTHLIEVTEKEAHSFACNIINIGKIIIMAKCGNRLPSLLTSLGYQVYTVDVSMFIAAGGGPHCLVNNITQPYITGGLSRNYTHTTNKKVVNTL